MWLVRARNWILFNLTVNSHMWVAAAALDSTALRSTVRPLRLAGWWALLEGSAASLLGKETTFLCLSFLPAGSQLGSSVGGSAEIPLPGSTPSYGASAPRSPGKKEGSPTDRRNPERGFLAQILAGDGVLLYCQLPAHQDPEREDSRGGFGGGSRGEGGRGNRLQQALLTVVRTLQMWPNLMLTYPKEASF